LFKDYKDFQASHPLTPTLQKLFKQQDELAAKCGVSASESKSNGQRIINDFNYSGMILIGFIGFIYMTFM